MAAIDEFRPDPTRPGYVYREFADYLAALVTAGVLRPGARLPGERDLAAEHGVSVGTVRRATAVLRDRGIVVTLPGKGTYITADNGRRDGGCGQSEPFPL